MTRPSASASTIHSLIFRSCSVRLMYAGWIVPAKYYQQVGRDGFMQKPIGAGPYKLVSQQPG
jgi:hypothetical protein